jgi:hypothetical protein
MVRVLEIVVLISVLMIAADDPASISEIMKRPKKHSGAFFGSCFAITSN